MAVPPFQDWLKDAVATVAALHEGQRIANGPDGDAFVDGTAPASGVVMVKEATWSRPMTGRELGCWAIALA
jgi:hypothetical protein